MNGFGRVRVQGSTEELWLRLTVIILIPVALHSLIARILVQGEPADLPIVVSGYVKGTITAQIDGAFSTGHKAKLLTAKTSATILHLRDRFLRVGETFIELLSDR